MLCVCSIHFILIFHKACRNNGNLIYIEAGGQINGVIDTLDCGNNDSDQDGDVNIHGTTTINKGITIQCLFFIIPW